MKTTGTAQRRLATIARTATRRSPALLLLFALLLPVVAPADSPRIILSPADFTELDGARVVDAQGAPGGKAILVEKADGRVAARIRVGPDARLPVGLYRVAVLLGSRDGALHWATVQAFPKWRWFTAMVDGGSRSGAPVWQTTEHLFILDQPGETLLEIRSRGDRDFYVGQVALEHTEPFWPKTMMSDAELFAGLDRRLPALRATIAAADAGDYARACAELATHFRTAPRDGTRAWAGAWASSTPAKRPGARVPEGAALALEDKMRLGWQPHTQNRYCTAEEHRIEPAVFSFATPQQWHGLYANPGRRWYGWFLSPCLLDLAHAYQASGDPRYARKAMDLVARFIDEWGPLPKTSYFGKRFPNPHYTKASFGLTPTAHGWSQSSGVRDGLVEAVWRTLQLTGACAGISDRERIEALKLCLLLTRFVHYRIDQTNGVPASCSWLVGAGRWLPEFPELAAMSRLALFRAASFIDDCHFPDGAYFELCYYRHRMWAGVAHQAAAQGLDTALYLARLRPTFDLNVYLTQPMGNFPWINDEGGGRIVDPPRPLPSAIAALGLEFYPDDPMLHFAHSFGRQGASPAEISKNFPWCGFMIMRTGWRPADLHLVFDGCRNTGSHNHQDQMNIVLAAYGSTLLGDNGYVGTGFHAPDRIHYINHPRGHNLLMIDELSQTPDTPQGRNLVGWRAWGDAPRANTWISAPGYDYAETRYDRPHRDCTITPPAQVDVADQERRVLFLKPGTGTPYWIVYDRVRPRKEPGRHNLQLLFHATPTSSAKTLNCAPGARIAAERAGLLILPHSDKRWTACVVRGDARPEERYWQGFVSGGYAKPLEPTDCAIFEHQGPLPVAVATILYPYPKDGSSDMRARSLPVTKGETACGSDEGYGIEVTLANGRDVVLALADPGALTRFGDFAFDGRAAVVRHDPSGRLASVAMIDGSLLRRAQEPIVDLRGRKAHYVECATGRAAAPDGVTLADGLSVIDIRRRPGD